ncbi:MAG: hypothetical protein IKH34_10780, partial [Oscillospiraceae bacterium]|nr:hypothetical protein [Oscillospiraceae bacterium]
SFPTLSASSIPTEQYLSPLGKIRLPRSSTLLDHFDPSYFFLQQLDTDRQRLVLAGTAFWGYND